MEAPNEEEEEGEGTLQHQGLKDWQKIRFPPLLSSSSSTSASNHRAQAHNEAQAHPRASWEMVMNLRSRDNVVVDDDCFIFPPSNHEGLHIVAEEEEEQHDDDDDGVTVTQAAEAEAGLQASVEVVERSSSQREEQTLDLRIRDAGEIVLKKLGLGFEMLWLKVIRIGALFRSYYNNSSRREVEWFPCVGLLLVPLLYWWQRRRRRARRQQQEKKERLILLIQKTDEKLSLLLDQITHINEVLSARHRIPIRRSG